MRFFSNRMLKKIKRLTFGFSIFFLTAYLPVCFMVYCPLWYKFMCLLYDRCDKMNKQLVERFISELTGFFLHTSELTAYWSAKEKYHLLDVRNILDTLALMAIAAIFLLFFTLEKNRITSYAKLNIFVTGSCCGSR